MNCPNCGKKIKENADVCLNCGRLLVKKSSNGRGIASMVLGIASLFSSLIYLLAVITADLEYDDIVYRAGLAVGSIFIPLIFLAVGLPLAVVERLHEKNCFNTTGFVLSIITCFVMLITFVTAFVIN